MMKRVSISRPRVPKGESLMGMTHVTVQVKAMTGKKKPYKGEFLVDTGVVHCLAPAGKLKAAGIKPRGKASSELADGSPLELEYGFAIVSFLGSETATEVIFGPENAEPILGVIALESVGIVVDPRSQALRRLHALPLK
jgi:clan AA aspartic protease